MNRRFTPYVLGSMLIVLMLVFVVRSEGQVDRDITVTASLPGVVSSICPSGTGGRVTCAYVSVPEDYDDPEISSIELFTARIVPPLGATRPPLVFLGDGLGGITVDDLGEWQRLSREIGAEVVLVDLRGTGSSRPRLACSELPGDEWSEAELSDNGRDAALAEVASLLRTCRDRLEQTVPLEAYSLDAMARDVELVRERLEIPTWAIGAAGDAAVVARRTEILFPQAVDSLVLLGATLTTADRHLRVYDGAAEVLDVVLGIELREQLDVDVEPLADRSIVFPVQAGGRTRRTLVSSETVRPTLARSMADPEARAIVPTLVTERYAAQQWRSLAVLRARQQRDLSTRTLPAVLAVSCGEPTFRAASRWWEGLDDFDPGWTGLLDDHTLDPDLCNSWVDVTHVGVAQAPTSPALVINGELDIEAPRSAAAEIVDAWRNVEVIVLDDVGRPDIFDACTTDAVQAFLSEGTRKLAAEC